MKPAEIEAKSFEIIEKEAGAHSFTPAQWQIVRRMIHTSADFEYLQTIRFHPDAIDAGVNAIRRGKMIITDTNMARVGIRKGEPAGFGIQVRCLITDPEVSRIASATGVTRARAAVDAAREKMAGGIYVVGNAPTALLRLIELTAGNRKAAPALIVGLPVGFVNAAESKQALMEADIPFISNTGRKGGSNVAASVVNALAIMSVST